MRVALVTPAASEPLTQAAARDHLRVTDTAEDALISSYTATARQALEVATGRTFGADTVWSLTLDGFPVHNGPLYVPLPPLVSVTSIQYIDADGATQTLATSEYTVDATSTPGRIVPAFDKVWPVVRTVVNNVTVVYVAGYPEGELPEPLLQAMRMYTAALYENRENDPASGWAVSGRSQLEQAVAALVGPYRVLEAD